MKSWKRILTLAVTVIVLLAAGGFSLYKFVIVPKYIEPVLMSVSTVMRDPNIQDAIIDIADDLSNEGIIEESVLKNYLRKAKRYTTEERIAASGTRTNKTNSINNINASSELDGSVKNKEEEVTEAQQAREYLGIADVNDSDDTEMNVGRANESYSSKYSSYNREDDEEAWESEYEKKSETDEIEREYLDNGENADTMSSEVNKAVSDTRAKILYDKIMNAMTASERSVFFSVMAKTDPNQLMQMYKNADKSGAKQYLQSILASGEYSEAVEIFFKYAPLLIEE